MIVTCVHVHVKPEVADRFIEATIANHKKSLKEPGNLRFDLVRETEDPDRFMIYEAYESEEAATAHKKTPHYLEWRDKVAEWMAEPRKGVKYTIIEPKERSQW
jgi:(4S)-4-hydroxy-5-phosphonooxypentane-2,3-dione isomerase